MFKKYFVTFILLVSYYQLNALEIPVSEKQADIIANKIWINEGAGLDKYLIHWNKGEEFASLGIGHFIWFTKDKPMWFFEAFPSMLEYIINKGAKPPPWLTVKTHCLWDDYGEWKKAKSERTRKYLELQEFLSKTKSLQAEYMIYRLDDAYKKIIAYAKGSNQKELIKHNFMRLLYQKDGSVSMQGLYMLVDYTNFKGDGTLETARYKAKGWGLFQVLNNMDKQDQNAVHAFTNAARFILNRLIRVSPSERNLKRFRRGWMKRMDTYSN